MRWIALYIVFSGGWGWGSGRKTNIWHALNTLLYPCGLIRIWRMRTTISFQQLSGNGGRGKSFIFSEGLFTWHGATFAPEWVHSGSLSWLYICLHDTTTKCHAGASHPGVSSPRLLYRGENFTPVRNLATVSCKRETRFGVKSVCR